MKQTYLKNPAASLLLMEIRPMLEALTDNNVTHIGIQASLESGMPVADIVEQLASQIQDNRRLCCELLGVRLVEKIEKYKMINI